MSKSTQLTPSQIKAFEEGAEMFMFSIKYQKRIEVAKSLFNHNEEWEKAVIDMRSPLQKGDKDVVVEYKILKDGDIEYRQKDKGDPTSEPKTAWKKISFKEILDVKVVRVQDVKNEDMDLICNTTVHAWGLKETFEEEYRHQLKEQNINRTYEDNDYIFLVEVLR